MVEVLPFPGLGGVTITGVKPPSSVGGVAGCVGEGGRGVLVLVRGTGGWVGGGVNGGVAMIGVIGVVGVVIEMLGVVEEALVLEVEVIP